MREIKTFDFGYAKVTIHPGKLSDEDFNAAVKTAATDFFKAIQRQECGTGKVILPPPRAHQD